MAGGRKNPGYAGKRPETAKKHEVWNGIHIDHASVVVVHGTIKPRVAS